MVAVVGRLGAAFVDLGPGRCLRPSMNAAEARISQLCRATRVLSQLTNKDGISSRIHCIYQMGAEISRRGSFLRRLAPQYATIRRRALPVRLIGL
jgi:hypothetical protein